MKIPVAGLLAGLVSCVLAVAAAADVAGFKVLKLEGNGVRWHKSGEGRRAVISYSVVAEAVEFPRARNCRKMTTLEPMLSASGLSTAAVRQEIDAAFAMWEAAADVSFREAASPSQADILIGAQVGPEGWAFADVFYDMLSREPVKPISKALICLNPDRRWKIGFDGDLRTYDLRYTIAHEIGHAIGLDHPSGAGQIMGYRYEERFRSLQPGDVAGAVELYGMPQSPAGIVVAGPSRTEVRRASPARRFAKRWGTRAFTARSH